MILDMAGLIFNIFMFLFRCTSYKKLTNFKMQSEVLCVFIRLQPIRIFNDP